MKKNIITACLVFSVSVGFAQQVQLVKATDLEKIIKEAKRPMIINMWATWCVPCIEELPYFQLEAKKHSDSLDLLLVSLDFKESYPKVIEKFAAKRMITAPIRWLDETNADYFCPRVDPGWSGAIPATLFINNRTGYRNFVEEQLSHETLKQEIMAMLK